MKKVLYLSLIGFILVTLFVVIKKDLYIDTYLYKYISMLINKNIIPKKKPPRVSLK